MRVTGVNAFDDLFDGLVFDEQVAHFHGIQDLANQVGRGNLHAVEANAIGQLVHLIHFQAIAREGVEALGLRAVLQHKFNLLGAQQLLLQLRQLAVVEHFAMVDDHNPAAKFLDVVQVVRSQQHRGAEFAIDGAQEMADVVFGYHVEANRRLIEEQQRRIMQQRGGQVAAHAFAERKFAHGRVQVIANIQDGVEVLHTRVKIALRDVVDAPQQLEGFDHGDVPPQLGALAKHHANGFHILAALAVGNVTIDANFTAGGNQNAGEHLYGGGFSGAVGADVADHLAAFDRKSDAVHRGYGAIVANEKILNR